MHIAFPRWRAIYMIASRLNMISSPPPPPSSAAETEKKCRFLFFSAGYLLHYHGVKYYSLRYIRYSVSVCLKLDLMDTCCGYYSVVLDSLDEGQISFMNVTAEMDRSTHLSSLTDSANVKRTTPLPPPLLLLLLLLPPSQQM